MTPIMSGPYEQIALLARVIGMLGVDPVAYTGRVQGDEVITECTLYVPTADVAWVRFGLAAGGLMDAPSEHLN